MIKTDLEKRMTHYFFSIIIHKVRVFRMGLKLMQFCTFEERIYLFFRLLVHDVSKFNPKEFIPYYYFYRKYKNNRNEWIQYLYDNAWNRHQKLNDHHWEYWICQGKDDIKYLQIPTLPLLEMLADWGSFRMNFTDTYNLWYLSEREKMRINVGTQFRIEEFFRKLKAWES